MKTRIDRAGWVSLLIWFAALFAYSTWAFMLDSPWTRALAAAGGTVPELQPGIPAIEPIRSLQAMGENTGDYLLWQVIDMPYAIMNFMVISTALALGLKTLRIETTAWRYLLLLPAIYLCAEPIENIFLASFAAGWLAPTEPSVLAQQFTTTLKHTASAVGFLLGVFLVIAALIAKIFRLRKSDGKI